MTINRFRYAVFVPRYADNHYNRALYDHSLSEALRKIGAVALAEPAPAIMYFKFEREPYPDGGEYLIWSGAICSLRSRRCATRARRRVRSSCV